MPRIRCHYVDCVFVDDGYCGAAAVEFDPDMGCMTFTRAADSEEAAEWDEEEEEEELEDWDEMDLEDEEEDLWVDDEETY